ncbi:hypothetical protein CKA81_03275 [Pollutimonas thiosulfatoxidans]|uniref:Channel protein TolC n=2 Tax=Pollutimonas thiosulfatoxidans TaxID=2028345 RepID=A0A410G9L5_9BURK|nr:hypothetical protein CKA81_03275 [Pollutimonas thiosulfatoxidans]
MRMTTSFFYSLRAIGILMLTLLACIACAPLAAQTFTEALTRTYLTHPELAAQRANLRALNEDVNTALSGWRPTVSASAGVGRNLNTATQPYGSPTVMHHTPSDVTLTASQPLINWTTQPKVEAAEARVMQGRAELVTTEQSVLLAAAQAYVDVVRNRELLRLHEINEQGLLQQIDYRREYFKRQLGTGTELAQAQARHAAAKAQLERVRMQLATAVGAFRRMTGLPPGKQMQLPEGLPPLPDDMEAIVANAVYAMPSVRSAFYGVLAARADVEAARGGLKPTVTLDASTSRHRHPNYVTPSQHEATIKLTLRIPFYQGGSDWSSVRGNRQRELQQQMQLSNSRLKARYDASEAWFGLAAAQAEIDAFRIAIAANKEAYEGVREQHAVLGELTLLEVLNARQELFSSEVSFVEARSRAAISHLQLLAVQGRLTAEGLDLPVASYDPVQDFEQTRGRWIGDDTPEG